MYKYVMIIDKVKIEKLKEIVGIRKVSQLIIELIDQYIKAYERMQENDR